MSYILDALRRADSERERGAIPNLHAKPVPDALGEADDDVDGSRAHPLLWAVVALSVVLIAVLAWQFMGSSSPAPVPAEPPMRMAAPAAAPVQAPVAAPPPPAPAIEVTPPPTPAPVARTAVAPSTQQSAQPSTDAEARRPQRASAKASAPASAEADRPAPSVNDLPENIRRELPTLAVGGAMYSKNAATRMLILNGQVFHEGEKVSNDLVLEEIRLKAAVLNYKGQRYSISY